MKIMIAGAWRWNQYEKAFAKGLEPHGIEVIKFSTGDFFNGKLSAFTSSRFVPGRNLIRLNQTLVHRSETERPELVLFWRPVHILPQTIKILRRLGIRTASYNNDDPFGQMKLELTSLNSYWLWYAYRKCLPEFEKNFFYREINCREALEHGAKHAEVLLPYFLPWQDRPITLSAEEQQEYGTDVVFAGHYEADGRDHAVRGLLESGFKIRIWSGTSWGRVLPETYYSAHGQIRPALGEDYTKALCGAKICIAFMSKLNRDTYTRRCFEIPACGRVMLAERTSDLRAMFREDEEACFFSCKDELVEKVRWLLREPQARERIANAGMKRVWCDKHDVYSRAEEFLTMALT